MLYYLQFLQQDDSWTSVLRVFEYITVRTFAGAGTAFLISLLLGPMLIKWLYRLKVGQILRKGEAPPLYELHRNKEGTPTMGGVLIISAIVLSTLLWAQPDNFYVQMVLLSLCYLGLVGFLDDYLMLKKKESKGLTGRLKLALQLLLGIAVSIRLLYSPETAVLSRQLMVPFLKDPLVMDMGWFFTTCFLTIIIMGSSNAVNLTDGLDGLAIGCTATAAFAYLVMAYAAGHVVFADYLLIPYVHGAGELAVFCGSLLGASLGFLWFNCHPAQVFMGDTGSLSLGGAIAMVAILIKQELVLIIVGGVFVLEALSVILQVLSFKLTGKRIFACAPLHHHFEYRKWSETQVTIRFWILSILFALLGVLSLKIR